MSIQDALCEFIQQDLSQAFMKQWNKQTYIQYCITKYIYRRDVIPEDISLSDFFRACAIASRQEGKSEMRLLLCNWGT